MYIIRYLIDAIVGKTGGFVVGFYLMNQIGKFFKVESMWNIFSPGYYIEASQDVYVVVTFVISAFAAAITADLIKIILALTLGKIPGVKVLFYTGDDY